VHQRAGGVEHGRVDERVVEAKARGPDHGCGDDGGGIAELHFPAGDVNGAPMEADALAAGGARA